MLDDSLETDCATSAQVDRLFDYIRPMIDRYIAAGRKKECER